MELVRAMEMTIGHQIFLSPKFMGKLLSISPTRSLEHFPPTKQCQIMVEVTYNVSRSTSWETNFSNNVVHHDVGVS